MTDDTLRDEVAGVLGEHVPHVGWGAGAWNVECLATDCRFTAHGIGHVGEANAAYRLHVADALLPLLARKVEEARGEALREAAQDWSWSAWSDVMLPKPTPPAVPVIAYSNRVGDWLRDRAAALDESTGREA